LIIDQENGNNIIYLPLDQIIQRGKESSSSQSSSFSSSQSDSISSSVSDFSRPTRTNERESRVQG